MRKRYYVYITYLLIVTLIVTAVSFSRYSTTVEGEGAVTVAKPVISYVPGSAALNGQPVADISGGIELSDIKAGDVLVYKFEIHNYENSDINQVLLQYRLSVSRYPETPDLPLDYSLVPDGTYAQAAGGWTYMGFGEEIVHGYTLTVSWDAGHNDPAYNDKEQKLQITIDTQQAEA